MNRYRFFIFIVTGLLISNGALLYLFFKGHPRHEEPKKIIIEKLHFNDQQIKTYEAFIQQNRKDIHSSEEKMFRLRISLYEQLKGTADSAKIDSLIAEIARQQYLAEYIKYRHFLEIKSLCKPEQQDAFNQLTTELASLFRHKPPQRPKP